MSFDKGFDELNLIICLILRDLRDTKHRLEVTSSEVKKKDGQLKEFQFRVEHGEGCKKGFCYN